MHVESTFGKYAQTLTELGPPASGAAGPAAADLIPKSLAEGKNSGYIFAVQGTPTGYAVTAVPEVFGSSGNRTFYSDQTMVIPTALAWIITCSAMLVKPLLAVIQ